MKSFLILSYPHHCKPFNSGASTCPVVTRASVGARVLKCKPFFFFFVFGRQKGSWSQAYLAETMETGHENLVDMLDNSAQYSMMSKRKNMSNVLANGVIFSTLKHTDPHRARVYKNAIRFFPFLFGCQKGVKSPTFSLCNPQGSSS